MTHLQWFRVGELKYEARDIGYGVEEDNLEGFFTGEVDTWGKLTFQPLDNHDTTLYLFSDEVVSWVPFTHNGVTEVWQS